MVTKLRRKKRGTEMTYEFRWDSMADSQTN